LFFTRIDRKHVEITGNYNSLNSLIEGFAFFAMDGTDLTGFCKKCKSKPHDLQLSQIYPGNQMPLSLKNELNDSSSAFYLIVGLEQEPARPGKRRFSALHFNSFINSSFF
jgi:hypothetical protein